jgi:hypothetical protein
MVSRDHFRLSLLGQEILENTGAKSFIDTHIDELVAKMDEWGIKTDLDAQEVAPAIIALISSEDSFKEIKDYMSENQFYKTKIHGKEVSAPLDLPSVSNIMGIYLRDKYLEQHPFFHPENIHS